MLYSCNKQNENEILIEGVEEIVHIDHICNGETPRTHLDGEVETRHRYNHSSTNLTVYPFSESKNLMYHIDNCFNNHIHEKAIRDAITEYEALDIGINFTETNSSSNADIRIQCESVTDCKGGEASYEGT